MQVPAPAGEEVAPKLIRLLWFVGAGVLCTAGINKWKELETKALADKEKQSPSGPNTVDDEWTEGCFTLYGWPFQPIRRYACKYRFFTTYCSAKQDGRQRVVVISGPTGAGKTRLALEIAKKLNGEIISADSVQVYRGLDIGSAKPSSSERQEVPHHLIDIRHPAEEYSAGDFFVDARRATDEILRRGRVPVVTGGTGLYLRWFIYGKPDVPKSSSETTLEVHSELSDLQRIGDWDAAVQLLAEAGDLGVQSLAANDWYRLRRRFEILKSSGVPPSAFKIPYNAFKDNLESGEEDAICSNLTFEENQESPSSSLKYEFICFFLTTQRLELYRSIDLRCEDMLLDAGLLSEAKWLLDLGLFPNSNSATRAIGYRQAMDFLLLSKEQGSWSLSREFFSFLRDFQKTSRNFAKRQLTWFRNEPLYQWIDASKPLEMISSFICDAYNYDGETGRLTVPEWLEMKKDMADLREIRQLKSYRPKNRHFISKEDCDPVIEWVRKTLGDTTAISI